MALRLHGIRIHVERFVGFVAGARIVVVFEREARQKLLRFHQVRVGFQRLGGNGRRRCRRTRSA